MGTIKDLLSVMIRKCVVVVAGNNDSSSAERQHLHIGFILLILKSVQSVFLAFLALARKNILKLQKAGRRCGETQEFRKQGHWQVLLHSQSQSIMPEES